MRTAYHKTTRDNLPNQAKGVPIRGVSCKGFDDCKQFVSELRSILAAGPIGHNGAYCLLVYVDGPLFSLSKSVMRYTTRRSSLSGHQSEYQVIGGRIR